MEYESVLYEERAGIGIVTLNRPEHLNGLAPGMGEELSDAFQKMAGDPHILVSILTGAGNAFCAGAYMKDARTHAPETPADGLLRSWGFLQVLDEYPKPVIAAVDGPAYGAGLNMVCLSDLILATPEARFCFPMARLGIIPGYAGAARLALFVGKAKASEMALMARPVSGEDAYNWGLVNKLVPRERLLDEALSWATEITRLAPLSVRIAKEDLRESLLHHMDLKSNRFRFTLTELTEDRAEGHRAWREKRPPVFRGR
jgi:enoyl-CoA hydratase/carnithine racemase